MTMLCKMIFDFEHYFVSFAFRKILLAFLNNAYARIELQKKFENKCSEERVAHGYCSDGRTKARTKSTN